MEKVCYGIRPMLLINGSCYARFVVRVFNSFKGRTKYCFFKMEFNTCQLCYNSLNANASILNDQSQNFC